MRIQDAKTVYAQSSDIKARTYLQYRFDMKRKAIAELEAKDWIAEKIREAFQATRVHLVKSGGDAFLWFLRGGGVTREPDYRATIELPTGSRSLDVEFQYADKSGLEFYDFKLSKVRRKRKGTIEPRETLFVYIHKPLRKYAILEAAWIMEHGRIGPVPAWGSRQAYRVPAAIFEAQLRPDPALPELIARIDAKNQLLSYQHTQLGRWRQGLQQELERVIDEKRMLTWHPERLDTLFKVVFALEHLNRTPTNAPLWLVYAVLCRDTDQPGTGCASGLYFGCSVWAHPCGRIAAQRATGFSQRPENRARVCFGAQALGWLLSVVASAQSV